MSLNFNSKPELVYQRKIVMGVSRYKGKIENNEIDTCSVLIAVPLADNGGGNAKGFGVSKISYGSSTNFLKFADLTFPCELELAFTTTTSSSGKSKDVLQDVRIPAGNSKG